MFLHSFPCWAAVFAEIRKWKSSVSSFQFFPDIVMGAVNSRSSLSGDGSRITLSNDIPGRNSSGNDDSSATVYFTENAINLLNSSFGAPASDPAASQQSSSWNQQNNAQMNQVLFDRVTSIAYQQGLLDAEKVGWSVTNRVLTSLIFSLIAKPLISKSLFRWETFTSNC